MRSELSEQVPDLPVTRHRVTTDDGVTLAVQVISAGHPPSRPVEQKDAPGHSDGATPAVPADTAPTEPAHATPAVPADTAPAVPGDTLPVAVLLANGIGVAQTGLDHLTAHLCDRYPVITWDYRGAGESRIDPDRHALDMRRHARDGLAVLDALGVKRAVVLGWSMGVPVALELALLVPERVIGIGALFGAAGRPLHHAFGRALGNLLVAALGHAHRLAAPAQLLMDAAVALPGPAWLVLSRTGFVGPRAHRGVFRRNVASVARADRRAYLRTLHALAIHDLQHRLPEIACPVLVVAGRRDPLTPPAAAEQMAAALPRARLVVLPEASHFGVIEYGPTLWEPIDDLIQEALDAAPAAEKSAEPSGANPQAVSPSGAASVSPPETP